MIPTDFPQSTTILQKPPGMTDAECGTLAIVQDGQATLSCWRMTWRERLSALLFGRVWLWVHFGGRTQPPVAMLAARTVFAEPTKDK